MKLILAAALLLASIAHFIIDSAGGASHIDGQAGGGEAGVVDYWCSKTCG
jgi:hypothetical protein